MTTLGSGLGFRDEMAEQTFAARDRIDFVEIIAERFTRSAGALDDLRAVTDAFTVIPHGVGLSIGTAGPLDHDYLTKIKKVSDASGSPFFSDHLCMTRATGIDLGHLGPLWFSEELLKVAIDHVDEVQQTLAKPLILENVAYPCDLPGAPMAQPEFFHRLVDATGCGVLLDVANVHLNAINHHFDAVAFIEEMPLHRVVQVHLAGGYWEDGVLLDSHSHPVHEEVWDLFALLCEKAPVQGVILEHDQNFPDFGLLLDQVDRARRILAESVA
ncbi:DUF692 domain-containing protein [Nonomuraea sp. NBC_01738]|uniref:DUF692 domain-containing protein n=1 Tax=Nonomuraea sp. NBC_01738 TaxID=2976003 RepID=UPI002E1682D7|nr:DUF692 domain-containing protein [Nonomuraea sp. NBC_01738]